MQKIKNIIFDLGGVIVNIDINLTVNAFKKLGVENFDEVYSKLKQNELFDQFETSKISSNKFREKLLEYAHHPISTDEIDMAWNALLLDLPKERLALLARLKTKYRLFLLSNTNEIHMREFAKQLQKNYGFDNLSHLFEKHYFSYEMKKRKPNAEAFAMVLNENKLLANETLFIDDTLQHILGARQLEIQSLHLKSNITINQLFDNDLVLKAEFLERL